MSALDILLFAAGAYLVARGFMRGLSGEFFSLLGIIGSFYCSMTFSAYFSRFLSEKWSINPLISTTASIVVIFLAVFFACEVMGKQLKKLLKKVKLSKIDALLGAVTGSLKFSVIVFTLLIIAMITVPLTGNGWVRSSGILTAAAQVLPVVYPPLEERGILPNIEKIQREAVDFISKQSLLALPGEILSGGGKPPKTSGDAALKEEGAERPDDTDGKEEQQSAVEMYRKAILGLFRNGERGDAKKTDADEESEFE